MSPSLYPRYVDAEIMRDDILHGQRGECHDCPVARALRRKFPNLDIAVFVHTAIVGEMQYQLTSDAQNLVISYDRGLMVYPGTVRLYNPKKRITG